MSPRICPDCEKTTELDTCPQCGSPTLDQTPFLKREDPLIGKLVAGRYRVQGLLGAGGMGKVYIAEQVAMKRQVALKVIRTQESGDMSQKMSLYKRFQREAMAASRLEHPNTVRVFDFGMAEDGTLFLAMELLRGTTLTKFLQSGPIPRRRLVKIAIQICRSLAEAHENGIVHRDLKPDNIMISNVAGERDFVKILDFGIAKITAETGQSSITRTGMIMGTPAYMAPEQATGATVGPGTDLYALGVILYEAISGKPPFSGETPLAILIKHANEMVPRLVVDGFPPDVPEDMAQLVYDLLEKKPARRPSSAIEVAGRLEDIDFQKLIQGHANRGATTLAGLPLPAQPAVARVVPIDRAVEVTDGPGIAQDRAVTTVSLPTPDQGTGYMYAPTDARKIFTPFGPDTVAAPDSASLPPLDSGMWGGTDPDLLARPRRGRIWIFVLAGVLLLGGAGGAAFWMVGGDRGAPPADPTDVVNVVTPAADAVAPGAVGVPDVAGVAARNTDEEVAVDIAVPVPASPVVVVPAAPPPVVESPKIAPPVKAVVPEPSPAAVATSADEPVTKATIKVRRPLPKPVLPRCVRPNCPLTGDCVDAEGRRVNGKSFCGDLAL